MTGPHLDNLEKAVTDHERAESDRDDTDRRETDQASQSHPVVVGRADYAMAAATYQHPEDVANGVFDRQAEAQRKR